MRVLIAAGDAAAAEAVRRALRYAPTCRVIGWVDARKPCSGAVSQAKPDVVVIDEIAGDETLREQVRAFRAALPHAKLMLLADQLQPDRLAEAAEAGVDAVIAKTASPAGVGMLVREIAAGHVFHFAPVQPTVAQRADSTGVLTTRELEILRHVAAGLSNSRIATELWVTEQTVKFHLSNVYRKLGLSNRTEAAHYAYLHGLVDGAASRPSVTVAA